MTATLFLNDGSDEIAEYATSGTVLRRFVPGPAINEPIAYENCSGATAPNCTGSGLVTEYFHTDHHGSVVSLSTAGGAPATDEGTLPFTYDPCGVGGALTGEPFKFVGMYLDAETGLYYDRARYYSSNTCRFLQTDPIGYSDDLDLYAYVGNDPEDMADPTGTSVACTSTGSNIGGGSDDASGACGSTGPLNGNIGSLRDDPNGKSGCPGCVQAAATGTPGTASNATSGSGYTQIAAVERTFVWKDPDTGEEYNVTPAILGMICAVRKCYVQDIRRRGGENDAAANGRRVHYGPYRTALGPNWEYEFTLRSGRRVDAINFTTQEIRELKPATPSGIRSGNAQLRMYQQELERETGLKWTTHLDTYTPQ